MLFFKAARMMTLKPFMTLSLWTHHAVELVSRVSTATPLFRYPRDLIALMSLFAVPERNTDLTMISPWNSLAGETTSAAGSRWIFFWLLSTPLFLIWINICSAEVCERADAAIVFENVPTAIG